METFDELLSLWCTAEARGATDVLDRLLDEDFLGDGPGCSLLDKRSWLARHSDGVYVVERFDWQILEAREHQHTAIGIGVQSQVARYRGMDWSGDFLCTVVAISRQDRWTIVNVQLHRQPETVPAIPSARAGSPAHRPGTRQPARSVHRAR
ncbi:nuclear transport factor 2 family protein [Amycolatopsis antarctica]|nr:nuclear transport factor 2 family protein [Amycolatopsis antarctica]